MSLENPEPVSSLENKDEEAINKTIELMLSAESLPQLVTALIYCAPWEDVEGIWIGKSKVKDIDVLQIARKNWKNLRYLVLVRNEITDKGMKCLAQRDWSKLTSLDLAMNTKIGLKGIKILSKIKFPVLEVIMLTECNFGSEGIKSIIKADWPNIRQFWGSSNSIGVDGHIRLTENRWNECYLIITQKYDEYNAENDDFNAIEGMILASSKSAIKGQPIFSFTSTKNEYLKEKMSEVYQYDNTIACIKMAEHDQFKFA